jgi:hypothetical protein
MGNHGGCPQVASLCKGRISMRVKSVFEEGCEGAISISRSRFEESAGSRCGVKALTLDALLKVLWKGIVEEAGFLAMLLKNRPEKK